METKFKYGDAVCSRTFTGGILLLMSIALLMVLVGCGGGSAAPEDTEGKLQPPLTSNQASGKNCDDIAIQFEKAGFENVTTEGLGDLKTGWLHDEKEVEEVSIDGETRYKANEWFATGARVVIRYHSYPEKEEPAASESEGSDSGAAAQEKVESAPEAVEAAADGDGGVSPDVKEALDSYEAVMDEYVDFMQKYKDSGYSASMMADYTSMLQKYTEFSAKIDAMDAENMSDADYAYYVEVTSRVAQKLLQVAS